MKEQDEWQRIENVEWQDPKFNQFNVDTRDFHVGYLWNDTGHEDIKLLQSYGDRFLFTGIEVVEILDRLFKESGGEGKWRCLILEDDKHSNNWRLKYLRIHRIDGQFIICDEDHKALRRELLTQSLVNKDLLGFH